MKFFRTRYRIVTDKFCGYEAQFRWWWMPFYMEMGFTNTHTTVERARSFIASYRGGREVVEELP